MRSSIFIPDIKIAVEFSTVSFNNAWKVNASGVLEQAMPDLPATEGDCATIRSALLGLLDAM